MDTLLMVPLASVLPNPEQPREHFDPQGINELAASIAQQGILQPLVVRVWGSGYQIIAGERRYRAACQLGLSQVPVMVHNCSEQEVMVIALVENLQRRDLNPLEEAKGYKQLLEQGLTQEQIAQRVGKARATVTNTLRLLQLDADALQALGGGRISAGHARALLALPTEQRAWGLGQIVTKQLSVRQAEKLKAKPAPQSESGVYLEVAQHLERILGTKVRFTHAEKGQIQIEYYSTEQLNELLEVLGYQGV